MLAIRRLTTDDLPWAIRLKNFAGWNQFEADWRRALELEPSGCFAGLWEGAPAATLTTCIFGDVAWIAMVLTDPTYRGRGIATAMMRHAIDYLRERHVRTIRLDATEAGRRVYEKLGFTVDFDLERFAGTVAHAAPAKHEPDLAVEAVRDEDFAAIARLDRATCGTDRERFLRRLAADGPCVVARSAAGGVTGFGMHRRGDVAPLIGPIAGDERSGRHLLRMFLAEAAGQEVFIDIPGTHATARELVAAHGLAPQRMFWRMTHGTKLAEHLGALWASSGPEKG